MNLKLLDVLVFIYLIPILNLNKEYKMLIYGHFIIQIQELVVIQNLRVKLI